MTPIIRSAILAFIVIGLAGVLNAQTLTDIGTAAPSPGASDIYQLSTQGNQTWPDGINYFTDNNPPPGQTFTTGTSPMRLVSVAIKTAGLNNGGGYGTPASTPTYYLSFYSMSNSTATLLVTVSAPNPGFTDGDWLKWSGLNVALAANKTYAFAFGRQPGSGGYAAMAVATNTYAGGEMALVPISGGTITTGSSHSFDAVFDLGLQAAATNIPASTPWPNPTYGMNVGNELELNWGPPNISLFYSAVQNGFNAVRIPCAWDMSGATTNISGGVTNYVIDPSYMAQVKQTVDGAIAAGMYVMINDHWDDGWLQSNIGTTVDPTINAKVKAYWTQIATTFAGYDNHLLFAACNEPDVASPTAMNTLMFYYQTFVNAVRAVGGNNTNRWLVLQGGGDTSWLNTLPTDTVSNRLMVEYHNYTPFTFTQLQSDASWGAMQYFWGPAYHYSGDPSRDCGSPEEGAIDSGFQQLVDQYVSKGIPVMIGEFQAAGKQVLSGTEAAWNSLSCYYWNKYLVDSAHAHGLSPFYWSTGGSPLDYGTGAVIDTNAVRVLTGGVAFPPPDGAPYAASGLIATLGNNTSVNLSWTAGSGAASCNIYRAAESGYESSIAPVATGIAGTSYTDTGLNSGTTYYYQVVAVNGSGPTGFSPEAHATTPGVNPDPAQFNFETDPQGWTAGGSQISGVATSTAQHYAGNQSLAVNFNGTAAGTSSVAVGNVVVTPGGTITFHVWIPSGSQVTTVQPYLQDYNWAWTSSVYGSLTANAWNTITVTVPPTAISPVQQLGIQFATSAAWSGTCYVDSVAWNTSSQSNTPPAVPTGLGATAGNAQVGLSWTASSGATSYNVKRATSSGGPYTTVANVTTTSYNDTGLANGTTYYYVVSALNAGGESANSSQVSATPQVSVPAAPTGLAATAGNTQAALSWTASSGATSYNVKRATTSGGPYTTVANISTTAYTDTGLANGTTYYYVVSALNAGGESANSSQVSAVPTAQLPSPWQTQDIGAVGVAGSANYTNGAFAVIGAGADIQGSADAFRFVYVTATGDCTIIARVVSVQNIDAWSKAGVMVRETLDAGAANAFIAVTPGNGVTWQYRSSAGGGTTWNNTPGLNAPYWVKLVRSGSTFTGYQSPDGTNWTQQGSTTMTISSNVVVGLALTSHNSSSLCTAAFDNVTVPGWPTSTPPAAPTGLTATAVSSSQINLTWSASTNTTSYNVKRATTSGGPYTTIATGVTSTSYSDTGLSAGTTYYYVVSAVNANGESANSSQVSATPQVSAPAAPTGLTATPGNGQAALSWGASSGATSYNVKRSTTSGGPYTTVANVTTTSYSDTGLVNGTTYYYVVSALNAGGESANSSQVGATPQVSAPAAPTGLVATPGNAQAALSWNASSGATSYNVKRSTTSGGPYTTVANVTTTSYTNTGLTNGTTYYYVVSALNAGGESANSSQVSAVPSSLPSPWGTMDIGAVGLAGSANYSNGVYTITGSGSDTWGTADQFRYVYQTGGTNCSITAKVLAVSNSNGSAKGGVMIRETLATNAVDCLVDIMASNGSENIWRKTTGGSCSSSVTSGVSAPYWVRVTRSGSTFIGYRSTNGTTWTPMATNTITMANSVDIGLFVCSHNNGALCAATFTNVVVSP